MNNLLHRLMVGSSFAAMTVATWQSQAVAQPASPQPANAPVEQVTVTGTSIRGVAPVGSNVVTVDSEAIKSQGSTSIQEVLDTVPQISTSNAAPQGVNNNSFFAPQIHQLAGSISNSTLSIVDGLRFVGAGGDTLPDPNIIPTIALERVEVLADGASSTYGSDAVSGVVNFITRKNYEGLELDAQYGFADQYDTTYLAGLWGTRWDKGSVMVAAGYLFQSQLRGSDRAFTAMGNYTSIGGSNYDSVYGCPTASIVVPGNSGVFLSPSSTTAVANTQNNANCNIQPYGDSLPQSVRENALIKVNQDITDRLTATVMMDYNQVTLTTQSQPGQLVSNTIAYGPGSGAGGQINPFYQAPAGSPNSTTETVRWVDLMGLGPNGTNYGQNIVNEEAYYSQFRLEYRLWGDWVANFDQVLGVDRYDGISTNTFCSSCAGLALNGTAQTNGSTTTSDVAGQNIVSLNLPLTATNALDVWDPAGPTNKTAALVAQSLYSNKQFSDVTNTLGQSHIAVSGSAFDLPAGPVKIALGGEYLNYHFNNSSTAAQGTGQEQFGSKVSVFRSKRQVYSAYAEMNVPLISPDMNIPLVQKLQADISGRFDSYSDVGNTANPKYAIDWTVIDGLKLRGNYSTSFVAAPLGIAGDPTQGGEFSGGANILSSINVPFSAFPAVNQLPGCGSVTAGQSCAVGANSQAPGLSRQYGYLLSNTKPQTGNGFNLGFDVTPALFPGLSFNFSYFNQSYKGGVTAPNITQVTTSPTLYHDLTLCPGGCSQATINAFTRVPQGATVNGVIPSTVYVLLNMDEGNVLNLKISGIDVAARYDWADVTIAGTNLGNFHIGNALTQFTNFQESYVDGPFFNVLGTSGINSTFPSIAMHSRSNLGWSDDVVAIDLFMNWTSAYHNASNFTVSPVTLVGGNYAGGGDHVNANITFDGHASYNFPSGWLAGDQVYFDIKNIFNKAPSFFNDARPSDVNSDNGYDTFAGNPIGRLVSVGLRANF
jgi:iron complex outermembrane receptor protein